MLDFSCRLLKILLKPQNVSEHTVSYELVGKAVPLLCNLLVLQCINIPFT